MRLAAAFVLAFGLAGTAQAQVRELAVPAVDYPAGVTPGAREHRVRVRYELSADGRIARCAPVRPSGRSQLDAESCRLLQTRVRIRPDARSRRGQIDVVWLDASTLQRPFVRGGPLSWALYQMMSADDYPRQAVADRLSGTTHFEVDVSTTGRPTACRVTQSSGAALLDRQTCAVVMTRGVYVPAVNGTGTIPGRVTWRLPGI